MEIDIYKLGERYNLTESEELALSYIVNNIDKALEVGVRGVARECFASTSVVMNLSKKLGYKGFIDMVYRLELSLKSNSAAKDLNSSYCQDFTLQKGMKFRNLLKARKRGAIFVHGVGFSAHIARYINDKLMILGYFSMMSEYMENMERDYEEKPLLIVVSKSGETAAILNLCNKAKANDVPIVVITGIAGSSMEKISEVTFVVKNSNLLDDRNLEKNDFFGNSILFFEELVDGYLKGS
ncbi:MAG: MurR/RpiR family transcriptional regulator [Cetobacterium sp.]|uniref:MurR/RpiR family transcriptional regulator n=2 Tax=Cetobacterium sp. TaxID=2071632 RepID=UPI0025FA92A1|nr:MurR/RpiR family transcriptional regulator [uncultured Cetobacterium sp.]